MRESDIEKYLVEKVRAAGGLAWKFTSPGTAGVPDRVILINGKTYFVEVKAPGQVPRPLQNKRIKQILKRGVYAGYVSTKEEVDMLIGGIASEI